MHGLIQEAQTMRDRKMMKDAHVNENSTQVLKLYDFAAKAHELDPKFLNN